MSSQSTSLREECRALDESSEFISWFRRHFPTVPSEVFVAFEGEIFANCFCHCGYKYSKCRECSSNLWYNYVSVGNFPPKIIHETRTVP